MPVAASRRCLYTSWPTTQSVLETVDGQLVVEPLTLWCRARSATRRYPKSVNLLRSRAARGRALRNRDLPCLSLAARWITSDVKASMPDFELKSAYFTLSLKGDPPTFATHLATLHESLLQISETSYPAELAQCDRERWIKRILTSGSKKLSFISLFSFMNACARKE